MTPTQRKAAALALASAIAIPAEGLRQWAYDDIANPTLLTVCYGHTGNVDKTKVYSLDECKALLDKDMTHALNTVDRCAPGLPVQTLAAFADAAYNLGPAIACDTRKSTAARMLQAGDVRGACMQLPRWNKARVLGAAVELPGLTKRRSAEKELCLKGIV